MNRPHEGREVQKTMSQKELLALDEEIRGAIETLDRIEEFTAPSEHPDNPGLALNL